MSYLFIGLLASIAGTVGFVYRINTSAMRFSWRSYGFNVASSVLVAVIVFWLSLYRGVPPLLSAAAIAIVAFLGINVLLFITRYFRARAMRMVEQAEEDYMTHMHRRREDERRKNESSGA